MMRRYAWFGTIFLALLALEGGPAQAGGDLDGPRLKPLLAEAAAAPAALIRLVVQAEGTFDLGDLLDPKMNAPMTLVCATLARTTRIDRRDFRLLPRATPASFGAALQPSEIRAGRRLPKHRFPSILHPEYVADLSIERNGNTATGTVHVRAPDVFEGTLGYTAFRNDTGWHVLELRLPHSGLRTTYEGGLWRLHAATENEAAGDDVALPVVGTVGALPPTDTRLVVRVSREGWIRVPAQQNPLSLLALRRYLKDRAAPARLREPDGSSRLDVVLDVDATIPWIVTQWIMQTCAAPEIKIYKLWLGARTAHDGRGAITTVLPKDRGLAPTPHFPGDFIKHKIKVFKRRGAGASNLRAVYAALDRRQRATGSRADTVFEIVAPPPLGGAVPHGYVVQLVDACLAAGARSIVFEGAANPRGPAAGDARQLKRMIDALRARPGVPMVRLNNDPAYVTASGDGLAAIPARGVLSSPWGTVASLAHRAIPEELLESPEDVPFEGPSSNGAIGIGGGAAGAFHGRGGHRPAKADPAHKKFEDAVDDGLRWLAAHQSPNGGWSAAGFGTWCDGKPIADVSKRPGGPGKALYDVGVTGLALQAFLGAGYTNRGRHPYARVVSRGLRYLKRVQDPEGCFGPRSAQQYVYNHAAAALAMVEAYGMTGSPIFRGSAQRALDFIALCRNPYFAWRYGVKPGDNDTSVSGWMTSVLYSATLINDEAKARGKPAPLTIDENAFDGMAAWLDKVTDPDTGRVGYVQRGTGPARPAELVASFPANASESLTAVGLLFHIHRDENPHKSLRLKKAVGLLTKLPPAWDRAHGKVDMYYWHWGALAMFQVAGEAWTTWRNALLDILPHQRRDGAACGLKGSWDPLGPWGRDGGRVYSTALMTLVFETSYRYAR